MTDFGELFRETEAPSRPIPCWVVVVATTHHLVAWSKEIDEDVVAIGHDCYDVMSETPPEGSRGIMLWEGTCRAVPCGTLDGYPGGQEYDLAFKGEWRPLTAEEGVALAGGYFEPGIDEEILNQPNTFHKHIAGVLKSAINAHGPITRENLPSAAKRVVGAIRDWNKKQRAKRNGDPPT